MHHFRNFHSPSAKSAPMTEDQVRLIAPSIFAEAAHESRSDRYTYIPSVNVLRGMMHEGFLPVSARQTRTRDESRRDFTKHMIRFRREGAEFSGVGDTLPEVVLINSHDGTSSYHLMGGLFRLICLNGMVIADQTFASVKVAHKGDVLSQVIEGAYTVIGESVKALKAPREWSQIALQAPEREALAEAAHVLRFSNADGETDTSIRPAQLLLPRRHDDQASDLWTTFNVVQENVIRGGLTAVGRNANGRRRRTTTRAVNGIDQDVRLNKGLWVLAERMAEIKAAA